MVVGQRPRPGSIQKLGSNLGSLPGDGAPWQAFTRAMDASRPPSQANRLVLEMNRTLDGRLEGRVRTESSDSWTPFSGVLELLKVLEDHA